MAKTRGAPLKTRWDRLKLKGKSLFIHGKTYAQVAPGVRSYGIRHGKKFKVWTADGGIYVRRIG